MRKELITVDMIGNSTVFFPERLGTVSFIHINDQWITDNISSRFQTILIPTT